MADVLPSAVYTADDLDAAALVLVVPPPPEAAQAFSATGMDQQQMADLLRLIAHNLDPQADPPQV